MAIVPFNRPLPQVQVPNPTPQVDDTYLAIAAAGMHEQGRLFEPKAKAPDLFETRPLASMGGRSIVESNNPQLGPTDAELRDREREFENQRRIR